MSSLSVSVDFETRSDVDLKRHGAARYFASPHFQALICCYSIAGAPVRTWTHGPCPADLRAAINAGALVRAHNASFERQCFDTLAAREGWPRPTLEQYRCTAAEAAAMALPRSLDGVGEALGLTITKDKRGAALIRKFSVPRRARKGDVGDGPFWNEPEDLPDEFADFVRYCQRDVETEMAAAARLVRLSGAEQELYALDQIINDRGIRVDVTSIRAALDLADRAKAKLDAELRDVTGGAVRKTSEPGRLVAWIGEQGVELTSAAKAELATLLECDDLPPHVRRAVEIRQEAAKTSVAKLRAMLDWTSADQRVRGTFLFAGAGTGRWTNMGVNFANMPRPRREFDDAHLDRAALFGAIRTGDPDWLRALYGDTLGRPLHLLADAVRGFVWAAPGHDLLQADYSGIEGAVIAWSSDERWKLDEMHAIMADPTRPDLYRQTAAAIMGTTTDEITKKHPLRQSVGKVSELACFAGETEVLTNNGVKALVAVLPDDLLWDGVEWVKHQGVILKGVCPVVDVDGIEVTPDHLIKTGATWTPASELVLDPSTLCQALETGSASLQSLALFVWRQAVSPTSTPHALVAERRSLPSIICAAVQARDATLARKPKLERRGKVISAMMTSSPTKSTAAGFLGESQRASTAVRTRAIKALRITEAEAFTLYGAETAAPFLSTWSLFQDGMLRVWNWIASMSTVRTVRAIFASSRVMSTPGTEEKRKQCKPESQNLRPVFDILNAGPRNRFTIFSRNGALVAHNCGFGGGVAAFHSMAKNYGVKLDPLYPHIWATADAERRARAERRYEACARRGREKTDVLSREAWIACELIKVGWRAANAAIAAGWRLREDAIRQAVREPGTQTTALKFAYVVKHGFLWAKLPSGRCLAYGNPRLKDQVWAALRLDAGSFADPEVLGRDEAERLERLGEARIQGATSPAVTALGVNSTTKKWERFALYGGLAAENDTQAIARDLLVNGMRKAEAARYPIIGHVYDEIICEVPRGFGDLTAFEKLICELPPWAERLPLSAGGWRGKRYRKD